MNFTNLRPVIMLIVGLFVGSSSTYLFMDRADMEKEVSVRNTDNDQAKVIEKETATQKSDTTLKDTVAKVVTEYIDRPIPCPELTDEYVEAMCTAHYVDSDILRDFRVKVDRARRRVNRM